MYCRSLRRCLLRLPPLPGAHSPPPAASPRRCCFSSPLPLLPGAFVFRVPFIPSLTSSHACPPPPCACIYIGSYGSSCVLVYGVCVCLPAFVSCVCMCACVYVRARPRVRMARISAGHQDKIAGHAAPRRRALQGISRPPLSVTVDTAVTAASSCVQRLFSRLHVRGCSCRHVDTHVDVWICSMTGAGASRGGCRR